MQINDTVSAAELPIPTAGRFFWRDYGYALLGGLALLALVVFEKQFGVFRVLRLVLGTAYVLYVPGYCLTSALFPRADDIDGVERAGLSIGLSIALVPLLALVTDQLLGGLHLWPILASVYAVVVLCMCAGAWRRSRLPAPAPRRKPSASGPAAGWRTPVATGALPRLLVSIRKTVPEPVEGRLSGRYLVVGALGVAVLLAAWVTTVPTAGLPATQFYVLGKEGLAENYPRQVDANEDLTVTLGLANLEPGRRSYRVEVWAQQPWESNKRARVFEAGPIDLEAGRSREWPVTWRMPWVGEDQVVDLLLFAGDNPAPYRQLRLWMDVRPEN